MYVYEADRVGIRNGFSVRRQPVKKIDRIPMRWKFYWAIIIAYIANGFDIDSQTDSYDSHTQIK